MTKIINTGGPPQCRFWYAVREKVQSQQQLDAALYLFIWEKVVVSVSVQQFNSMSIILIISEAVFAGIK